MGLDASSKLSDTRSWYTARRVGETHAAAKVLTERDSGRILGAHILGPEASEVINLFGLAMRSVLSATDLRNLVSAYPSSASDEGYLI